MVATNVIYCGDCKNILRQLKEESVDLIYLDPPFFSNRTYEVIWDDGAELRSFEDRWKGGIMNYVNWMGERLELCHRVLKKTGSIYVHCDWHAVHYLKVKMDKIFGEKNFLNDLIWCYSRATSPKQKMWGRMHDNILFYTKSKKWTFNVDDVRLPYAESSRGREGYEKMFHKKGDLKGGKCKLNPKGKFPEDWWQIPFIRPNAQERLGYPTQKPEALLDRIIKASSNKDDIVLDPFAGCGTTCVVAHKLKRRWIGIDVSPTACKLMQKRMRKIGISQVPVLGLPTTKSHLKKIPPFEFQNWVMQNLRGTVNPRKSGDMGIDGMIMGTVPVQVKQSEGIGRNVVDNFETALNRRGKKKGIIVGFSFGKGSYEEVARARAEQGLDIILLTIDDMLKAEFDPMKFLK